jgi:hypothetical protein
MTPKHLLLAMSALFAASAFAQVQAPLGVVTNVEGVVTATQGVTGVTVTPGTVIQNNMRFVTTTRGSVTLRMNSGCTVAVPPGHGVTVQQSMTCPQLTAAVQPVVPVATASAAASSGSSVVNGVILLGGIAVTAGVLHVVSQDDEKLSGQ